jgi:predicted nucleic acid-binding protein
MEIMHGAGSKAKQVMCKTILSQFDLVYRALVNQIWAMQQMEDYLRSNGVTTEDCLIASVAHRLQMPLYTHNLKDMASIIGTLAVKPYA